MTSKNTKIFIISIIIMVTISISAVLVLQNQNSNSIVFPKIDRYPDPADYSFIGDSLGPEFPSYNPNSSEQWQVNVRSCDLSGYNLSDREYDLMHANFDNKTVWPEILPEAFNPEEIMELGKNPGFDSRTLHQQGITGKGVGIAIIDQCLLVNHQEYYDRVKLYEEVGIGNVIASMHGCALASIAAGETVGIAPEADLYFMAVQFWETVENGGEYTTIYDYKHVARAIDRILEINKVLPEDRKIRVICVAKGWSSGEMGYDEVEASIRKAMKQGIFFVNSNLDRHYQYPFHGLGRHPLSDPNNFTEYEAGLWWQNALANVPGRVLVPMDSRTTASPTGIGDYVFYRAGGWSWAIPYIAGAYALACQVDPAITPARFLEIAIETGVPLFYQGYNIGKIINPNHIIVSIQIP